jgi:hypothetical protein
MKLLRIAALEAEIPALLDAEGPPRDLTGYVPNIAGEALGDAALDRPSALDPETLLLASVSRVMSPRLGHVISAGTPPGVGLSQKLPVDLGSGCPSGDRTAGRAGPVDPPSLRNVAPTGAHRRGRRRT